MLTRCLLLLPLLHFPAAFAEILPKIKWTAAGKDNYTLNITSATTTTPYTVWACWGDCYIIPRIVKTGRALTPVKLPLGGINYPEHDIVRALNGLTWTVPAAYIANNENVCVSFSVGLLNNQYPAGQDCAPSPVPLTTCEITVPSLQLTHGTLASDSLNGNVATTPFTLRCNNPADITLKAMDPAGTSNKIVMSPGLTSRLKLNSVSGSEGITGKGIRDMTVNLSSTLLNSGPITAGNYSASGILTLSFE